MSTSRGIFRFRPMAALLLALSACAPLAFADAAPADTTAGTSNAVKPSTVASPVAPLVPMAHDSAADPDMSGPKAVAAPASGGETHAPGASLRPAKRVASIPADEDSADFEEPPTRIPDVTGPIFREVRSIPYPNGAIYVNRGLTASFLGGKHQNLGEAQSLFQWQGELGYFYTPNFSGGVAFRITAGEPSNTEQKIRNRYFVEGRFHKAWSTTAFYIGPQIGLDNLNILNDRADTAALKGTLTKAIPASINPTNASLGLDMGAGWKFSRWVGATLGTTFEYSLVSEEGTANSLNLHINPGFAVDILSFSDSLRNLVPAMYLVVEFQGGYLLFEKNQYRTDRAAILGISLVF